MELSVSVPQRTTLLLRGDINFFININRLSFGEVVFWLHYYCRFWNCFEGFQRVSYLASEFVFLFYFSFPLILLHVCRVNACTVCCCSCTHIHTHTNSSFDQCLCFSPSRGFTFNGHAVNTQHAQLVNPVRKTSLQRHTNTNEHTYTLACAHTHKHTAWGRVSCWVCFPSSPPIWCIHRYFGICCVVCRPCVALCAVITYLSLGKRPRWEFFQKKAKVLQTQGVWLVSR